MKKIIFLSALLFCYGSFSAQETMNEMLVNLLKNQLKDFKENPPTDEEDMIIKSAPAFIPPNGKFDMEADLKKHIDSVKNNIQVSNGGASLFETDAGELRIDFLQVNTDWVHIPCWQDMHISPTFKSATTTKGKEIILPQNKYEEYMEKGYIKNDMSFGRSFGNNEIKVYLSKEPTHDEYPFTMKGELFMSYPAVYEAFTLSASDTGKTIQMGNYSVTLISLKKNTVTYSVSGSKGFSDEYSKLCTNKDGKPFVSLRGSSTDYDFYLEAKKNNFVISDKRIHELAAKLEADAAKVYAGGGMKQMHTEKVPGAIFKITFYKVVKTVDTTVSLEVKAED